MTHDELVKSAKGAIEALFADTSVPQFETRSALETLAADIQSMIDSINDDDE